MEHTVRPSQYYYYSFSLLEIRGSESSSGKISQIEQLVWSKFGFSETVLWKGW